jgi:hypothetical protein
MINTSGMRTVVQSGKEQTMSRYIDAEYCEDFFDRWESRVKNADPVTIDVVQNTRTLLRDAPSIDIVCCKECRYCKKKRGTFKGEPIIFYRCTENNRDVESDDYCSWGEREGE